VIVIGIVEKNMRKMVFAFAALAAFGLAMPLTSVAKAEEGIVVIKTGDRDRDHDRRWHRDRDHRKLVIIKKHRHRDHDHD
jgi:Ni/Co efflux regulator RcnB